MINTGNAGDSLWAPTPTKGTTADSTSPNAISSVTGVADGQGWCHRTPKKGAFRPARRDGSIKVPFPLSVHSLPRQLNFLKTV